MIVALLLSASLLAPAHAAEPATPEEVQLVELFLKTPTSELPDAAVPKFLSIDPDGLPKKLRKRFIAKRLELYTLKQIADNKRKGLIRSPDPACDMVQDAKSRDIEALKMAGYNEITGEDERCLEKETQCTERGLMCEFSLQVVDETKKKEKLRHYFLFPGDPLATLLVICRPDSKVGGNGNFFSGMKPACTK